MSPVHQRRQGWSRAVAVAALGIALGACVDANAYTAAANGSFYGPSVKVGNGAARAYVTLANGAPQEVGVALSEGALENLRAASAHGAMHMPDPNATHEHVDADRFVLALPENAGDIPFTHVGLDWNPGGHVPPGIYDHPHFDFHFYIISEADRLAMVPEDPNFVGKSRRLLEERFVPAGYINPAPIAVPQMGVHWIDPKSPELNGEPFTTTFIYGSWDGKLIFAEPMVTRAFIKSKPQFEQRVAQPPQVQKPGYYPTTYAVRYDEATREYRISLRNFLFRGS